MLTELGANNSLIRLLRRRQGGEAPFTSNPKFSFPVEASA
jgi:hypothetical protein